MINDYLLGLTIAYESDHRYIHTLLCNSKQYNSDISQYMSSP